MRTCRVLGFMALVYVLGLGEAGYYFRHALNTDAVAYLRIADYYATGQWELALSGYWGPLTSWILAGLLKMHCPPLAAARLFMAFSAVIFWWACLRVYRTFRLPEKWVLAGMVVATLAGVYWSVQFITPDLLLSGLMGFAVCQLIRWNESGSVGKALSGGVLWGTAYLAKAVAFPLALAAMTLFAAGSLRTAPGKRGTALRHAAGMAAVFFLIAGPWMLVLSLHYHQLTFSTTPRITHTLTGPPDRERYHPFARTFHPPEPGRVTSWEEPSLMPYPTWSPFENAAYAKHQAAVLLRNLFTALVLLASLNLAWPVALAGFLAGLCRRQEPWKVFRCGQALVLPGLLVSVYLPCYFTLAEQRFFYAALPFLFAAVALCASQVSAARDGFPISERRGWWMAVGGGVAPLLAAVLVVGDRPKMAGDCAAELAGRIKRAHLAGPVAGSGNLPGGRAGLYVAFLLNQPWCGDEPRPDTERLKGSGACLAVATRHSAWAAAMQADPALRNLDPQLFGTVTEAKQFPLVVYQIKLPGPIR